MQLSATLHTKWGFPMSTPRSMSFSCLVVQNYYWPCIQVPCSFSKKVTVHYRCTTTSKCWPSGLSSSILMQNAKNEPLGLEQLYLWNIFFYFRCCETSLCPPVKYVTDRSKAVFFCASFVLFMCFRVCSLLPSGNLLGKGWPLGSCLWCLIGLLSCSHVVSWVRCGTWLFRFLIFATSLILMI